MTAFSTAFHELQQNLELAVRGKSSEVRHALCCLFAEGHLLLEDVPGTGKTTLARAIGDSIEGQSRRIQFTPDLLPNDITGGMIFEPQTSTFGFRPGPVFSNVVLADEINRASPKTQSALLEVMAERHVTTDGVTRSVPRPFLVIATQNSSDFQGTYPLPEVQLDRFTMQTSLGYADHETEVDIVDLSNDSTASVGAVTNVDGIAAMIGSLDDVHVARQVREDAVTVCRRLRDHPDLRLGPSTRGVLALLRVARAQAASEERDFVTPDDVRSLMPFVLTHRLVLTPEAEMRRVMAEDVLREVRDDTPVPRHLEFGR